MTHVRQYIFVYIVLCIFGCMFLPKIVFGGTLLRISDVLSNSAPSMMSQHTIEFTPTSNIPISGKILVTLDVEFNTPTLFNHTDVDIAVAASSGAPFVDRSIAAAPSATDVGVSVITGTSSSVLLTLSSSDGINAGETIQIELGTNAKYGSMGDQLISNPLSEGIFRIDVETKTVGDVLIDGWNTLVALVNPTGVGPVNTIDLSAPIISNVLPPYGILLAGGTTNIQVSLNTHENATCRWSDVQGTPYVVMTNFFDQVLQTLHTVVLVGLVNDTTYDMYIVCADYDENKSVEYHEMFSIGVIPVTPGSGGVGPPGDDGSGYGGGPFPYGGPYLIDAKVELDGLAYPGSLVTILKDGEFEKQISTGPSGSFNALVENLIRGTYTFGIFAEDIEGRRSATYNTTISINADTGNIISRIYVAPTIEVNKTMIDHGEDLVVFGYGIPNSVIEVFLGKQIRLGRKDIITATTTVSSVGNWEMVFNTDKLTLETYEVKARGTVSGEDPGDFSASLFVGVGVEPQPDYAIRADLNRDGYVNIIDFSILMFNWETADPIADINLDGIVDLTDFSIMLYYWTG